VFEADPHEKKTMEAAPANQETAIGKYHVFATLGRGGMADVFLSVARGPVGFNKLVVIKRLRAQLAEDPIFRNMFLDEARLAARLSHPNIVNTFEVGEHKNVFFIAMEYLEGQALNKVLREAIKQNLEIPPAYAARIVADALAGLAYAHELRDYDGSPLGIIHRDISPHNLFVTYDGHTKVVDFGIAKARSTSTSTEVGVLKGKVAYMAPEQAMGSALDARADLFAMGIVLWELIARQRLFPGDNAAATLHRLMSEPIPRVSSVVANVPPGLDDLIARALEKDPDRRFASATSMRQALEGWMMQEGAAVRSDDIAALLGMLFSAVRDDVQGKVRQYMSRFSVAASTQEVRALTQDSVKKLSQSGSGSLLRLGAASTGTGRVSIPPGSLGLPVTAPGASQILAPPPAPVQPRSLVVPIAVAGTFALAIVAVLVFGLRRQEPAARDALPTVAATTAAVAPPSAPGLSVAPPPTTPLTTTPAATTPPPTDERPKDPPPVAPGNPAVPKVPKSVNVPPVEVAPPAKDEVGFVTLDTSPWTKVSEGGRSYGVTPIVRVQLPAGPHTFTLENPERGIKSQVTVVVKAGETVTKRMAL
jgi:serine/threonine-protein kinase